MNLIDKEPCNGLHCKFFLFLVSMTFKLITLQTKQQENVKLNEFFLCTMTCIAHTFMFL